MATTAKLISAITLTANSNSVTFGSNATIPQSFSDLILLISARQDNTNGNYAPMFLRFNGSASNYSDVTLTSDRVGVTPQSTTNQYNVTSAAFCGNTPGASLTASTFGSASIYIPNYTGSTNKTFTQDSVSENNGTADYSFAIRAGANLWSNTSAITSITIYAGVIGVNNFVPGSTFYLYGITRSDNVPGTFGIQATGGDVTISGGYKYHVFKSSGTFNVTAPGWAEVLVIGGGAGGGGGAGNQGPGGGGAGGVLAGTRLIPNGSQTVIVGAGGIGGNGQYSSGTLQPGTNGSDSIFGNLGTGFGGGGGGGNSAGINGGSGGGGMNFSLAGGASIQTSQWGSGYGNAGGTGNAGVNTLGGGGGGAGAAGVNGASGGTGGAGLNIWSTWATATGTGVSGFYAGGGGAATSGLTASGGSGGGSSGASGTNASAATINTGSGGGAAFAATSGTLLVTAGAGGSGIVIIRYPVT